MRRVQLAYQQEQMLFAVAAAAEARKITHELFNDLIRVAAQTLSYSEIAGAAGVSEPRIGQIVRKFRQSAE